MDFINKLSDFCYDSVISGFYKDVEDEIDYFFYTFNGDFYTVLLFYPFYGDSLKVTFLFFIRGESQAW